LADPEFVKFAEYYNEVRAKIKRSGNGRNIWIIKPGENTNRGCGIEVASDFGEISEIIK